MVTIAITGSIACGKSLAGRYVREMGIPVCEADEIGHEVLARGETVHAAVKQAFGPAVMRTDGDIDRTALAAWVFADPARLARLNALTHPEIMRRVRRWVEDQPPGTSHAAVILPLLHEIRDEGHWDVIVCVAAPATEQLKRLAGRGLTDGEAFARIRAQLAQTVKMEHSDYVIYNCGSADLLKEQTERVMRSIRGERS